MAGQTLDQLPPALALNGSELLWIYQQGPSPATPWIGLRCTSAQLASLFSGPSGIIGAISMRQLFAAMAFDGVMVTAFNALSADITNSNNIAWYHAYAMTISDPFITGFIQPTIGYTTLQMELLFVLARTFPV